MTRIRPYRFFFTFLFGIVLAVNTANAAPYQIAELQALDKVTARVYTFNAPLGDVVRFGTLEIIARYCDKRPPEETPESTAFLDIWEIRYGEPTASVFRGWMFASTPALSALEHPVYDVWVLGCHDELTNGIDIGKPILGNVLPRQ